MRYSHPHTRLFTPMSIDHEMHQCNSHISTKHATRALTSGAHAAPELLTSILNAHASTLRAASVRAAFALPSVPCGHRGMRTDPRDRSCAALELHLQLHALPRSGTHPMAALQPACSHPWPRREACHVCRAGVTLGPAGMQEHEVHAQPLRARRLPRL